MVCEICGKKFDKPRYLPRYLNDYKNICSSECFGDKFWLNIIKVKDECIIVNGECYCFNKNKPIGVKMLNTGEIFKTNNLLLNGTVPEKFREQLPDNAEYIIVNHKTNLEYIRQLPAEELAKLLVRDNVFMDIEDTYCDEYYFKNDPLNRIFMDEEDAIQACVEWLNSNKDN